MQRSETNFNDLPADSLHHIINYLSFNEAFSLISTSGFYYNNAQFKLQIRKAYIKKFLTAQPELVDQYSEETAFCQLVNDFVIPFEKQFFKISQPELSMASSKLAEGKYKDIQPVKVCLLLGF